MAIHRVVSNYYITLVPVKKARFNDKQNKKTDRYYVNNGAAFFA